MERMNMSKPRELPEDKMEVFFNLIQLNPPLYDKTSPGYRDKDLHSNVWSSIQETMGIESMTADAWKTKWRSAKDTFTRKKKEYENSKRSGAGRNSVKDPNKWKWWKFLQFLTPFVEEAETESNISDVEDADDQLSDGVTYSDNDEVQSSINQTRTLDQSASSSREDQTSPVPPPKKTRIYPRVAKKTDTVDLIQSILKRSDESKQERRALLHDLTSKQPSPDELLFQSYGRSMEEFSDSEKAEIRLRVAQVFYEVRKTRQHVPPMYPQNSPWPKYTYTNL